MKRIFYSGGSIMTGDAIADAVLAYAQALAKSPLADVVNIPIVQEDTLEHAEASMLIGPASQLMTVPITARGLEEPVDEDLVIELERRSLLIGSPRPIPQAREGVSVIAEDYE